MNKKKILISANVVFTIANFRKELIKFFIEHDYEIVCVANNDDLSDSSLKVLNHLNVKFIQVSINRKGLNPLEDFKYMIELVKIYKKEKPDIVLHFTIKPNIYGTIAAKFAGVKSINTINGLGSAIIKDDLLSKILKYLYKFSLIFSSRVLFQNTDDRDFFISKNLVNIDKVSIVPGSGVDTKLFINCYSNTNKLTFLLVSRLLKDKGIYEYIDAIKELKLKYKEVIFLLGGQFDSGNPSGIEKDEIKNWENNGLIKFIGKTDKIKDFFKICDVIVLPSYREGLSRLLIEAASASKPIITTNVAGCKDIVENGVNGFLCEVKNSESLKKSIEKMILLDKDSFRNMQFNAKKIARKRFDKDIVNKVYLREVQSL